MSFLDNVARIIAFKRGVTANINLLATRRAAIHGEPHVSTDDPLQLWLYDKNNDTMQRVLMSQGASQEYRIGGVSNYVLIDSNGNLRLIGAATVWDDLSYQLINLQKETGSSAIVNNLANCSVTFTSAATTSDYVPVSPQMPHRWKILSVIFPHLHWEQVSANTPNWLLQWRWQTQGQTKTTAWTNLARRATNVFPYVSGTLNQITAFGAAGITPPAGAGLSDIVNFRIIRDVANASGLFSGTDPESADVEATSFDPHLELDSLGSNQEYIKD